MITWNPFKLIDGDEEKETPRSEYTGPARDPFDAVPVRNEQAETRQDSRSNSQIRMRIKSGKGLAARLAGRLGYHRHIRVNLDRHGSFYWSLVDGVRDLREIERRIREEFALQPDESRRATLSFTRMLMIRHLVHLDLRGAEGRTEETNLKAACHGE